MPHLDSQSEGAGSPDEEDKTEFTCIQYKVLPPPLGEEMRRSIAGCNP